MPKSTIIWDENQTAISTHFDDVYFNTRGAVAETNYVFVEGNNLVERFLTHQSDTFIVGETGFGSGLSFLVLSKAFLAFKRQYPNHILQQLKFFSVEKYPLSAQEMLQMHENVIDDDTLALLAKQLRSYLFQSEPIEANISLAICYDDISAYPDFLSKFNILVDAWFFDGFSPAKNPDMWSHNLFQDCFKLTQPAGTFATFTSAGFVRRNLTNAGFQVLKRKGFGIKREMLVGYKSV